MSLTKSSCFLEIYEIVGSSLILPLNKVKTENIHDFYSSKMNGNYKFAINKMYSFAKSAGVDNNNVLKGFKTVSKKKSL